MAIAALSGARSCLRSSDCGRQPSWGDGSGGVRGCGEELGKRLTLRISLEYIDSGVGPRLGEGALFFEAFYLEFQLAVEV